MIRLRAAPSAVLAGLVALGGCSLLPSVSSKPSEPCPNAVILKPLAQTAVFGPAPERRPDNVAFYGILSEADLKCEYSGDALRIMLDAIIVGERGPTAKGDSVDLQYFVAVTAPDQSVLNKKSFAVRIAFEGGKSGPA